MTIEQYLIERPIFYPCLVEDVRTFAQMRMGQRIPRSAVVAALGACGYEVSKPADRWQVAPRK